MLASFVATLVTPAALAADVDAVKLLETVASTLGSERTPKALGFRGQRELAVVAEVPRHLALERGYTPVGDGFAVLRGSADELLRQMTASPAIRFHFAPPFRPQLDQVQSWTQAAPFRQDTGLTGEGVIVGIVDTGVDVTHPSLRREDGSTRVRWWIDFGEGPLGLHPDLEEQYGCAPDRCAVLSGADIDTLLDNEVDGDEPSDARGHGTHVASIAAGRGEGEDALYRGMAPGADLVVVQVGTGPFGAITDANILLGTQFVFDRASEAMRPAVVNISLGSNFGAHDGSSSLERGLGHLATGPGRAVVVAAGNSGGLYSGITDDFPEPLGIHTEVHVPRGVETGVPVLTPPAFGDSTEAALFIWVAGLEGDSFDIGFDSGRGVDVPLIAPGRGTTYESSLVGDADPYTVTILNQMEDDESGLEVGPGHAAVIVAGRWKSGRTFGLRLGGAGNARIWIESTGELDPSRLGVGAMLPRALKTGTIAVPASSADLISVGATLNRKSWVAYDGETVERENLGALVDAPLDTTAYFSAAGPTRRGELKPDLVAPGAYVIGAMSREADPRVEGNLLSHFASFGRCEENIECFVVDDFHAVASGTSMAAPVVTGAVALLLQRDPTLSSRRLRDLLQAGTRPVEGVILDERQVGAGALDLVGSLRALERGSRPESDPTEVTARVELANSFAYPDGAQELRGILLLRDAAGAPAVVDDGAVRFVADGALGSSLRLTSGGAFEFGVSAPELSGGKTLALRFYLDDRLLLERAVPIAVDPHVAEGGFRSRGGCEWRANAPLQGSGFLFVAIGGFGWLVWRRRSTDAVERVGQSSAR